VTGTTSLYVFLVFLYVFSQTILAQFGLPYNRFVWFFSRNSVFLLQQFSQNNVLSHFSKPSGAFSSMHSVREKKVRLWEHFKRCSTNSSFCETALRWSLWSNSKHPMSTQRACSLIGFSQGLSANQHCFSLTINQHQLNLSAQKSTSERAQSHKCVLASLKVFPCRWANGTMEREHVRTASRWHTECEWFSASLGYHYRPRPSPGLCLIRHYIYGLV